MAFKTKRALVGRTLDTQEVTDDIYNQMSAGQQFLAAMAEAMELKEPVAEYEGRYFITNDAVKALWEEVFG